MTRRGRLRPAAIALAGLLACSASLHSSVAASAGNAEAQRAPAESKGCLASHFAVGALKTGEHVPASRVRPDRPDKGEWFRDPTYGTCIVRLTDHENEPPKGFARNDYSRRQPFNANDSRVLVYAQDGYWHLYDTETLKHVRKLHLGGGSPEPQWHPGNPDLLFLLPNNGGMSIMVYDVTSGERRTVADFTEPMPIAGYPDAETLRDVWPSVARLWTRSEGSPSMDMRYWAFQAETQDFKPLGLVTYDLEENRIIGIYDFEKDGNGIGRPDHLSISPKGRYVVASWNGKQVDCPGRWKLGTRSKPCGLMAFAPDYSEATGLAARGPHSDIAIDANGNEVIVISNYITGEVEMISLDDGDVTELWDIYDDRHSTAMHVSGKAYDKPGWVLISTYGHNPPKGADEDDAPWYVDKLMAVELKEDPRIINIANMFNVRNRYFSEPHAAVNRDFTRIVYNSNWGTGRDTDIDTYLVRLPEAAIPSP